MFVKFSAPVTLCDCRDSAELSTYEQMVHFRDPKDIVRPRISLNACLEVFAAQEIVDDFYSTAINAKSTAAKYVILWTILVYNSKALPLEGTFQLSIHFSTYNHLFKKATLRFFKGGPVIKLSSNTYQGGLF